MPTEKNMVSMGDRIVFLREKLGISQAKLAEQCGLSAATIGFLEKGRNRGTKRILDLARALHITPEWLVKGGDIAHAQACIEARVVMEKVALYAKTPAFYRELELLVKSHERKIEDQVRKEKFAERVLREGVSAIYGRGLLRLNDRSSLGYGPREFVPDEYQTLENNGLVYCSYGPRDSNGLGVRELVLTSSGIDLVQELLKTLIPRAGVTS